MQLKCCERVLRRLGRPILNAVGKVGSCVSAVVDVSRGAWLRCVSCQLFRLVTLLSFSRHEKMVADEHHICIRREGMKVQEGLLWCFGS